jgi:deoxyribodipyrimidine photo-lyase
MQDPSKQQLNLVWLKRDLRTQDHLPLAEAELNGLPYVVLYIFEPSMLAYPDCADRHLRFQFQSLQAMQQKWSEIQRIPVLFHAEAIEVFNWFNKEFQIQQVFSYQESGIDKTFQRDLEVASFFKSQNIQWKQYQRNGVLRAIQNRKNWDTKWHAYMSEKPLLNTYSAALNPSFFEAFVMQHPFQVPSTLLIQWSQKEVQLQPGGELHAWQYLQSFLNERFYNYQFHISKPAQSRKSCSRLSPFIAWGNLSLRQVYYASKQKQVIIKNKRPLQAFLTRLKWHDHFVQKFEQACSYETKAINKAFDDLKASNNVHYLEAWKTGNTGIPLVDANMRALIQTGWVNFRMRALLVSFLTHHLDIDWKLGVYHLAHLFLDYEPGIHYTQFQMQAGTTGVNTLRVYNPVKNALEHDPDAEFIKKWIPELSKLPTQLIAQPWLLNPLEAAMYQFKIGEDYPAPIIELQGKHKTMVDQIYAIKKTALAQTEGKTIVSKLVRPQKLKTKTAKKS